MEITKLERELLKRGYDSFTTQEKNDFASELVAKKNVSYTDITEEFILNYHKELKSLLVKEECEQSILEGFKASNGNTYRTNRDDQTNMLGQRQFLNDYPQQTHVKWKTENKGYIVHTKEEWLSVYYEAFQFKFKSLLKYDEMKSYIELCKTHEDIVLVDWLTYIPIQDRAGSNVNNGEVATPPTYEEPTREIPE